MLSKNVEELIAARGYSTYARTGDGSCHMFINDNGICLNYYPKDDAFQLDTQHKMLTISTGRCSPFSNENHFKKFEKQMTDAIFKLKYL